jgi:hypothetical protein
MNTRRTCKVGVLRDNVDVSGREPSELHLRHFLSPELLPATGSLEDDFDPHSGREEHHRNRKGIEASRSGERQLGRGAFAIGPSLTLEPCNGGSRRSCYHKAQGKRDPSAETSS